MQGKHHMKMLRKAERSSVYPLFTHDRSGARWDFMSRRTGRTVLFWWPRSRRAKTTGMSEAVDVNTALEALDAAIPEERRPKD